MNGGAEAWLLEHAVRGDAVLSWVHPHHTGYAYPEAAGLLLRWLGPSPRLAPVAARLRSDVDATTVGRDGSRYTFDTAVVLAGLQAFAPDDSSALDTRWAEVAAWLRDRNAVRPAGSPRWSTTAGPHLLKLAAFAPQRNALTPGFRAVLGALQDWPVTQHADGRIETPPHAATYLHAHAYAAEGLLVSGASCRDHAAMAHRAVAFLAKAQAPNGGLPAWHDGQHPTGPWRADATAQAVRLFLLTDRQSFAAQIRRGLAFLDALSTEAGVVRYDSTSDDLNTWATLFTLQARRWAAAEGTADLTELL